MKLFSSIYFYIFQLAKLKRTSLYNLILAANNPLEEGVQQGFVSLKFKICCSQGAIVVINIGTHILIRS